MGAPFCPAQAPDRIVVTAAARSIRPGELVVLTIATPEPRASLRVRAFDSDLAAFRVDAGTWRVLVGIDLATAPGKYRVEVDDGIGIGRGPGNACARRQGARISDADASPSPRGSSIRRRRPSPAFSRKRRSSSSSGARPRASRLWDGAFVRPVPDPANSAFGARSIFNGQPRSPHGGADFLQRRRARRSRRPMPAASRWRATCTSPATPW